MADIAESVAQLLADDTDIVALVSDRIYPDEIAQDAPLPAIVYWKITTRHTESITGLAGSAETRLEFEVHASGNNARVTTSSIAKAIKNAFFPDGESIRGSYTDTQILEVSIDQGERNYTVPPSDGSDDHRYITAQDYVFSHLEN